MAQSRPALLQVSSTHLPAACAASIALRAAALPHLTSLQFDRSLEFVSVRLPGSAHSTQHAHHGDSGEDSDESTHTDEICPYATAGCMHDYMHGSHAHAHANPQVSSYDAVVNGREAVGLFARPPEARVMVSSSGFARAIGALTQLQSFRFIHGPAAGRSGAPVPSSFFRALCGKLGGCAGITALDLGDAPGRMHGEEASLFRRPEEDAAAAGAMLRRLTGLRTLRIACMRLPVGGALADTHECYSGCCGVS